MSCVFIVTPIIIGGWPVITTAAAAAAASLGYRQLQAEQEVAARQVARGGVDVEVDNIETLSEGMRADSSVQFGDGTVTITVARDARGKTTVHVDGVGLSKAELEERGSTFLSRMIQQYAYQKVASELKAKGFGIVEEKVTETQAVRVRFRKTE